MHRALTRMALRSTAIADKAGQWRTGAQAVAGTLAFGLGFWGFMLKSPPGDVHGWLNNLFRTVQLITLHFPTEFDGALPWQLQIGRLAVPLVAVVASLDVVVGAITRPVRLAALPMARNHVVFLGPPKLTDQAMAGLIARDHKLILVHPTIDGDRMNVLEGLGVTVVAADPFQARVLGGFNLHRARAVFVATGSDVDNANLAAMVIDAAKGRHPALDPLILAVEFEREDLADELVATVDGLARDHAVRFCRLSPDRDGLSLELVRHAPAFSTARAADRAHVLVIGLVGGWSQVLSRLLVVLQDRPDETPILSLILDANELEHFTAWSAARPDLSLVATVEILARGCGLLAAPGQGEAWRSRTPAPQLVIVLRDDAEGLATALALRRPGDATRADRADILVRQSREDRILGRLTGLRIDDRPLGAIVPFGGLLRAESIERLLDRAGERRAIALHAAYLDRASDLGVTSRRVLDTWEHLPENLRDANRVAAGHLPILLAAIGRREEDFDAAGLAGVSDTDWERLAEVEHRRWCADRIDHGWRHGAHRDDALRLHPCLVPWDDLSEADRHKDRNGVRIVLGLAGATRDVQVDRESR